MKKSPGFPGDFLRVVEDADPYEMASQSLPDRANK